MTARAADGEWTCDAVLDGPLPEERQEVFDALVQADPVFTLHFGEGGEILVDVVAAGDGARLVLTAHEPAAHALQG
ncbi:hypothetical protein M1P56_15215 [Streptomyces sp. HU2014]|uniref:hypothetical protein n=1 Tax=Streptomyces sp. HU2014 TaxID=2939414 RepID=UPI002010173B|nr:hypothetical protein [Streptomyces sp. HU2014]UQI45604.1 hypothetical protein M1P56_15215 [Streptomyces sp. HU2014]